MTKTVSIRRDLAQYIDNDKQQILPKFFKTGKGEYGEGDKFLGITVPNIRKIAKCFLDVDFDALSELLHSPWHEERMCALLIMVEQFKLTQKKSWIKNHSIQEGEAIRRKYNELYLAHTQFVNNWDLVDLTAPTLVGSYLINKEHHKIYELAHSKNLWEQRIAVVSTLTFIKQKNFDDIYALAEVLLHHPHDLMQKAIGWMLREAGKQNKSKLMAFLELHAPEMPRTMLRYSIEKFSEDERHYFMKKTWKPSN